MRLYNKQSGFTLIELIIVITIMAIVAAIAIPSYLAWMPRSRINGAARQVMGDFMAARMKAVTQNNEFKIFFLANGHEYMMLDDDDNDGTADVGEWTETKDIQNKYHDVTLTKSADPVFQPRGTVSLTTITLNSTNDISLIKYVKVAITGRVKIDDIP